MRYKLFVLLLLFQFLIVSVSFADSLVAEGGIGESETEARTNAVSELSFMIYADVKTVLSTDVSDDPNAPMQIVTKQTDVISALPIYGAVYKTEQVGNIFKSTAELSQKAVSVYKKEIDKAVESINKTYKSILSENSDSAKYPYVMAALTHFENLQKLKTVLSALGGEYKKNTLI